MFVVVYPIMIGLLVICLGTARFDAIRTDALRKNEYESSGWDVIRLIYYFTFGIISFCTFLGNIDENKDTSMLLEALDKQFILFMVDVGIAIVVSVSILIYLYHRLNIGYYKGLLRYVKKIDEVKEKLNDITSMKRANTNDLLLSSEKILKKTYNDLEQSYQAAVLVETFKTLNDFQITKDTKEDLVTQIDICENMRKL